MSRNRVVAVLVILALGIIRPTTIVKAQGPQEGIKVHGHWVIDIRDPDGTLITHREFENALADDGPAALSDILTRLYSPGPWMVELDGPNPASPGPCAGGTAPSAEAANGGPCLMVEGVTSNGTLTVAQPLAGGSLVLSGSIQATQAGTIAVVHTWLNWCSGATAPSGCQQVVPDRFPFGFTTASLAPVNALANQIIQVTVTISFS